MGLYDLQDLVEMGIYDSQDLIKMDVNYTFVTSFPKHIVKERGKIDSIEQLRDFIDEDKDETSRELNTFLIELYNSGNHELMPAISDAFRSNLRNYGRFVEKKGVHEVDYSDKVAILQGMALILHVDGLAKPFMGMVLQNGGEADFRGVEWEGERYGTEYFIKLNELGLVAIDRERMKWVIRDYDFDRFNLFARNLISSYLSKPEFRISKILQRTSSTLRDYPVMKFPESPYK